MADADVQFGSPEVFRRQTDHTAECEELAALKKVPIPLNLVGEPRIASASYFIECEKLVAHHILRFEEVQAVLSVPLPVLFAGLPKAQFPTVLEDESYLLVLVQDVVVPVTEMV